MPKVCNESLSRSIFIPKNNENGIVPAGTERIWNDAYAKRETSCYWKWGFPPHEKEKSLDFVHTRILIRSEQLSSINGLHLYVG